MGIYWFILIYIILGRVFAKQHKKFYVVSCFMLLILVAGLRNYSVGIDLNKHYARNFISIANTNWSDLNKFTYIGGYDIGFVVFCKFISYISSDVQSLIMVTAIITFGLIGRYIYIYSDDPALETFMFFSSMLYFMYLNIVAQALAIAMVTVGLEKLAKKQYLRYILWVIIASTIHSSAIVCIMFIPLTMLPLKKKYVFRYTILVIIAILGFDQISNYMVTNIFTNFSYYLTDSSYADGRGVVLSKFNLFQIAFTVMCVIIPYVYLYYEDKSKKIKSCQVKRWKLQSNLRLKKEVVEFTFFNNNFFMYITITGLVCRVLITKMVIMERVGYYFYFLGFSVLCKATENIADKKRKKIILIGVYMFMLIFFLLFGKKAGNQSYGVVPYKFL